MEQGAFGEPLCWDDTDECLREVHRWISSIHPDKCVAILHEIADEHDYLYAAPYGGLLAHVVEKHGLGPLEGALLLHNRYLPAVPDRQLVAAVISRYGEWEEAILSNWETLAGKDAGPGVVNVLARAAVKTGFGRFFDVIESRGLREHSPNLFRSVLYPLMNSEQGDVDRAVFFDQHLPWLFEQLPADTVHLVLRSPGLESARDALVPRLFQIDAAKAARLIAENEYFRDDPRPVLAEAARVLWGADSHSKHAIRAVAAALPLDPEWAIPNIVEAAHTSEDTFVLRDFDYILRRFKDPQRLFDALAANSCKADRFAQDLHAQIDLDLASGAECAVDWMQRVPAAEDCARYRASLIVHLLSDRDHKVAAEAEQSVLDMAERLFTDFGHRPETDVLKHTKVATLKGREDYPRLRAIALARDVLNGPPRELPRDEILSRLRSDFPFTYEALGAEQLVQYLEKGRAFCNSWWYEDGHEASLEEAHAVWERSTAEGTPHFGAGFAARHHARALNSRAAWEERFKRIIEANPEYDIKSKEVRESHTYWTELLIHAALLPEFKVEREPTDVHGLEDKRPDFRLTCDDGAMILEITAVEAGPSHMLAGVQTSTGTEMQKQVVDKWRKQFKRCETDPQLPVVIAVHVPHTHDLDFDLFSSLYGQMSFTWSRDNATGATVAEGSSRVPETGFYHRSGIACISGVLGFTENEERSLGLQGDLFLPLRNPTHPVSPRLWAKLRRALFGERPAWITSRWNHLPGVHEAERDALIDAGIDRPDRFAADLYDFDPELGISEARWEDIRKVTAIRVHLSHYQRVADLPTVNGDFVAALAKAGIHTLQDMLRETLPPELNAADLEHAKGVAASYGFKPNS